MRHNNSFAYSTRYGELEASRMMPNQRVTEDFAGVLPEEVLCGSDGDQALSVIFLLTLTLLRPL